MFTGYEWCFCPNWRRGTWLASVTVLRSSGPAFEQAAIEAVKQWRYTSQPYEGIVTVTLNFTQPR